MSYKWLITKILNFRCLNQVVRIKLKIKMSSMFHFYIWFTAQQWIGNIYLPQPKENVKTDKNHSFLRSQAMTLIGKLTALLKASLKLSVCQFQLICIVSTTPIQHSGIRYYNKEWDNTWHEETAAKVLVNWKFISEWMLERKTSFKTLKVITIMGKRRPEMVTFLNF